MSNQGTGKLHVCISYVLRFVSDTAVSRNPAQRHSIIQDREQAVLLRLHGKSFPLQANGQLLKKAVLSFSVGKMEKSL